MDKHREQYQCLEDIVLPTFGSHISTANDMFMKYRRVLDIDELWRILV